MTPHSLRAGLVRWEATDAAGHVIRRCVASSRALAEAAIGGKGLAVSSAASNACGWPARIAEAMLVRLCSMCAKPLAHDAEPECRYHPHCFQRHRRAYESRQKASARAKARHRAERGGAKRRPNAREADVAFAATG